MNRLTNCGLGGHPLGCTCLHQSARIRELEAQVSQLTAERDEARELVRLLHGSGVYHTNNQCRASVAMLEWGPKWRADSARLGVTEAEVEKDLAPKETT